jgi:pullulanase/glycogen debranching enzyme
VNFALCSRHASRVQLELFAQPADATPTRVIALDPVRHRTGDVWHVWVAGLRPGQLYAYRVDGPYQAAAGHRFNVHKLLLDPFATAIAPVPHWDFRPARGYDCGSADIYTPSGKGPENSINFITCHDGFTLNDLVSYRYKRNEANGEHNHDGTDEHDSDNYDVEGATTAPQIESVRKRQIKNFLLTLLISRGVPMLLGGDEFCRTQHGHNNAYCQDNETSWYDWRDLERHQESYRFTRGMIAFRRAHPILSMEAFYTDAEVHWYSPQGGCPAWTDPHEKRFACQLHEDQHSDLYLMFNASTDAVDFLLPPAPYEARWHLAVDTARAAPYDVCAEGDELLLDPQRTYHVSPRSSAILVARQPDITNTKDYTL